MPQVSVAAGQVWWLYGPPSVGKSATAWQLFTEVLRGEPRGYVDVDQVGMCYPEPPGDPGRHALKARAVGRVVRRFAGAGVRSLVVSGVVDEHSLSTVADEVDPAEVTFCRLRVDPGELERRLRTRYAPEDVARALDEADAWDRDDPGSVVVDTSLGAPLDVALRVAEIIRSTPSASARPSPASRSAAPDAAGTGGGRAVLVCGPTGVGKSAVGFGLFADLLGDGRTAAYLDLQQLGFLADLPDGAPDSHEVVAACVGDLWEQYRTVGAQDLVLSGEVDQEADVQRYRNALGGTSLTVCRLDTTADVLRDRILARTYGGGPPLAGDTLLGLTAAEADVVLHEALTQQAQLETADIADIVLDTASKSAEEVIRSARTAFDRLSGATQAVLAPSARTT